MTSEIRHWGICITCLHRSDCLSFQNGCRAGRAIWDCNEYETTTAERTPDRSAAQEPAPVEDTPAGNAMGLCSSCAGQADCLLPFRQGGVWFCGDFH